MAYTVSRADLRRLRLLHHFRARDPTVPEELIATLGAVQAQEKASALLAIRARLPGVTEAGLTSLLEKQRSVVRTWCLRGTLHLLAREDVHWLLALVAPRLLKNSRRRYRELELDEATLDEATELILVTLADHRAPTRAEISAHLEAHGISTRGQRLPHLLRRAALLGLLCLGPERAGKETYVLLEERARLPAGAAVGWTTLARRYLAGYGPASVEDFARWAGALKGDARAAFAAQDLVPLLVAGETFWLAPEQANLLLGEAQLPAVPVRLLPAYDPLLLGYEGREWWVPEPFSRRIHPGGGFLRPTLLAGGEAAGTWKMARRSGRLGVTVTLFHPLCDEQFGAVEEEVRDLGRFYGQEAALSIEQE